MWQSVAWCVAVVAVCCRATPQYLWGNALYDDHNAQGPDGEPYPSALIDEMYDAGEFGGGSKANTRGRALFGNTMDPWAVGDLLMRTHEDGPPPAARAGRSLYPRSTSRSTGRNLVDNKVDANVKIKDSENSESNETLADESFARGCPAGPPAQLCPTKYNTTAPMWGTSLTSGKRVTIVQKFPDLLQQVIFHECTTDQCDFIHGRCTQTYTPYLFLVIPLGPVTLTGQDYVMVESGCACQPKYSTGRPYDTPADAVLGR